MISRSVSVSVQCINSHNKKKQDNTSSKFKGVSYVKRSGKWRARVNKEGKEHTAGTYDTEIEAAIAYNIKAKELYGEFANINKISDNDTNIYFEKVRDIVCTKYKSKN